MKKKLLLIILVSAGMTAHSQLKVGDVPSTIDPNAVLEMQSTNKGMLLPRVELTGTADFAPLAAHVEGMTVYNTATAGDVTPGYYYDDGAKWVRLADGANASNFYLANTTTDANNTKTATMWRSGGLVVSNIDNNNDLYYGSAGTIPGINKGFTIFSKEFTDPSTITNVPTSVFQVAAIANPTGPMTGEADVRAYNARAYSEAGNTQNFGYLYGTSTSATHFGSGNVFRVSNLFTATNHSRGGKVTNAIAIMANATSTSPAAVTTNAISVDASVSNSKGGKIINAYGIKSNITLRDNGTTTNGYNLYIGTNDATNAWGVYQVKPLLNNFFAGNTAIGGTASVAPTNKLHVIATTDPLRLEGLQAGATTDKFLTVDANGVVRTGSAATATAIISAENGLNRDVDNIKLGGALTMPTIISTDAANNLVIKANGIGGAIVEANQGLNVLASPMDGSANAIALRGRVSQNAGTVGQLRGVSGVAILTGGTVSGSSNGGYFNNQLDGGVLGTGAVMSAVSGDVEATSGTADVSNVMIGGRFGAGLAGSVVAGRAVGVLATAGGSTTANIGTLSVINDATLTNIKTLALGGAISGASNGAAVAAINPTTTANNYAIYSDGNVAMKSLPATGSTSLLGIDANGNVSTTPFSAASANSWNRTGNAGTVPTTDFIGTTDANDFVIKTDGTERIKVTAAGNIDIPNSTATTGIITKANVSFLHNRGINNTALGKSALNSPALNLIGGSPGSPFGTRNVAIGQNSMRDNTDGFFNTALGFDALKFNTTGFANVAVGTFAMSQGTSSNNTVMGWNALPKNTGNNNTAIGYNALGSSDGNAKYFYNSGESNVAIGGKAMRGNSTGSGNVAIGFESMIEYTASATVGGSGSNNVAIGLRSLQSITSGSSNIAIGHNAGNGTITSTNNVQVGTSTRAGESSNTTLIGSGARVTGNNTYTNATAIGYLAEVDKSNSLVLGGTGGNAVNVGIGTKAPTSKLQVVGLPKYASDADAGTAGLTTGALYQTNGSGTGIFANLGVLMVKQ